MGQDTQLVEPNLKADRVPGRQPVQEVAPDAEYVPS